MTGTTGNDTGRQALRWLTYLDNMHASIVADTVPLTDDDRAGIYARARGIAYAVRATPDTLAPATLLHDTRDALVITSAGAATIPHITDRERAELQGILRVLASIIRRLPRDPSHADITGTDTPAYRAGETLNALMSVSRDIRELPHITAQSAENLTIALDILRDDIRGVPVLPAGGNDD